MSEREKNLLLIMLGALFIVANVGAYLYVFEPQMNKARSAKLGAERKLEQAEGTLAREEQIQPDKDWLETTGSTVVTPEQAQTKLRGLIKRQADSKGLDTRSLTYIRFEEGAHYTRVRVFHKCTGMEEKMQQFLTAIHKPKQRQVITKLKLKPQANDLERIDCEIEVEQWVITPKQAQQS